MEIKEKHCDCALAELFWKKTKIKSPKIAQDRQEIFKQYKNHVYKIIKYPRHNMKEVAH